MFEKRKDNTHAEPEIGSSSESGGSWSPPSETFNTRSAAVIGATIKIKGEVNGEENLVIEGSVVGSVSLKGHRRVGGYRSGTKHIPVSIRSLPYVLLPVNRLRAG